MDHDLLSPMRTLALVLLVFTPACATTSPGDAQRTDEREVIDTVQAFFDVIGSKDARAGAEITLSEGVFLNVREEEGRRVVKHFSNEDWLAELPEEERDKTEAFDGEPIVLVAGDVAMVWARYVFHVDGELSHTGVDVFNLLYTEEGWKIAGGVYSVVR